MDSASTASEGAPTQGMPAIELWKAQLAYVSGTILAWGALLLQLWPVLARLPTGAHVQAMGRDEGVSVPAIAFYLLALLVAVGLGMLIFGAAHIVARGFWLARFSMVNEHRSTTPASDRIARSAYVVIHVFWATSLLFVCLVPLTVVSALLAMALTSGLGWPLGLGRVVASILTFALPFAAVIALYRRRAVTGRPTLISVARRIGYRNLSSAAFMLPLLWVLVIEFSYVADVRLDRHVFSLTTDQNVVVSIELGGAVSNPVPAHVELIRLAGSGTDSEPLPLNRVEDGRHVSIVPTRSLRPGRYVIAMTYPHGALSPVFPFFRRQIDRRVGFVVVD